MHDKQTTLKRLAKSGIVAILRFDRGEDLVEVARALAEGGVDHVEITMTVPGALEILKEAASHLGDQVSLGAGTVLDPEDARRAVEVGARYIVSPGIVPEVIEFCNAAGVAVLPGAMTPTEVYNAWRLGADVVKVFPVNVAGPGLIKDLRGPYPSIPLLPTGRVDLETAPHYIRNGAIAVGVGGAMVSSKMLADRDFGAMTTKAREFVEVVNSARES